MPAFGYLLLGAIAGERLAALDDEVRRALLSLHVRQGSIAFEDLGESDDSAGAAAAASDAAANTAETWA